MILLKISNHSELIASKLGQFIERLTPDSIDQKTIEDLVIRKMIENLSEEGVKGEISAVNGIEVNDNKLILNEELKVRNHSKF